MIPGSATPLLLNSATSSGGYQIERSLRFNSSDSAYLSRVFTSSGNRTKWTWAAWIKRSSFSSLTFLFHSEVDGNNETVFFFNSSDQLELYNYQAGSFNARKASSAVFRDPSAWYHIVVAWDTANATAADRVRLYVNGSRITSFSNSIDPAQNTTSAGINVNRSHRIGSRDNTVNYLLNGYLADVFFVDAQGLDPSSFTEVSATTGQLIPKAYTGTFTGNSFWLKFADNSAATATTLGKDSSGLGNNWTPNNLSVTNGNGSYVSGISGSLDLVNGGPASSAFDGSISTGVYPNPGSSATWTAPSSAAFTSSARIYVQVDANGDAGGVVVNSNTISTGLTGASGWVNITSAGSPISTITWSRLSSGSQGVTLKAVEIDGEILIDNTFSSGNDSLVDVPSSTGTDNGLGGEVRGNYCTLNPLSNNSSQTTLSNGNLQAVGGGGAASSRCNSTIAVSSGKWYFEATFAASGTGGGYSSVGIAKNFIINQEPGQDADSYAYLVGIGSKYNNSSLVSYGSALSVGDVFMCAFDLDNSKVFFGKNGTWFDSGSPSAGTNPAYTISSGSYTPITRPYASSGSSQLDFNFGQRPFAYTAPSGFKALNTASLPSPLVTKPSTVMDVKLYTGNGSTQTITLPGGMSPDLVWIKGRSVGYGHRVFDTVRGTGGLLYTNATDAEVAQPNANDTFSSFNSNGFSLGAGIGLNQSSATYAAWCWDAGSSTVTDNTGSIQSSRRTNATAGISIVSWSASGTSSTQTVGHGLGVTPQFIITKSRTTAGYNWNVYHPALAPGYNLFLQLTNAAEAAPLHGWLGAPTSSVITLTKGSSSNTNVNIGDMIAYCFAPVAGYSSFGSYTGNGSADGPFVYTGFRPRWILIKRSDNAGSWWMFDAARTPYNTMTSYLFADLSSAETTDATQPFDFTSNGFKLRTATYQPNTSGATFIYAAFAEHPFQYARAR